MRILTFFLLLAISCLAQKSVEPKSQPTAQPLKILAGEKLILRMVGIPTEDMASISGYYIVSPKGEITLPKLKSPIHAAGQTNEELGKVIQQASVKEKIYERPTAIVGLPECRMPGNVVMLGGELNNPGEVPWRAGLTLLKAIEERGGVTEFANVSKVKLVRGKKQMQYDLRTLTKENDPVLDATDQVVVSGFWESPKTAILQPGQGFRLRVTGVSIEDLQQISGNYTISAEGTIKLPYIQGVIKVADKAQADVVAIITRKFREVERLKNAEVVISLSDDIGCYDPYVAVGGEVKRPQGFPFKPGVTLLEAIKLCGGLTTFSDIKKVKLIRGKTETVYDLKKLTKETSPILEPGDQIVVPGG